MGRKEILAIAGRLLGDRDGCETVMGFAFAAIVGRVTMQYGWEIKFFEGYAMAIDPELLEILACPVCKVSVHLTAGESGLKCDQCQRVYPIRDDIPVMLVDEATIEAESD
ncbi:MAG: Trm112 family protein [Acidobacteriota bacterium]